MQPSRSTLLALAALTVLGPCTWAGRAPAAGAPRALQWADLVPPVPAKPLKPFFGNRPVDIGSEPDDGSPAPPPREEGAWMSAPVKRSATPVPVVSSLDGETVVIGGYVVPLDFQATKVKEFLLVPFVGACIHVPPPPANQIIYVNAAQPFEVKGSFDPVYVTGKISVTATSTGLADAGYSIAADKVELRPGP